MTTDTILLYSPLLLLAPFFTNLVVLRLVKKSALSKAQAILLVVITLGALATLVCLDFAAWDTLSNMLASDDATSQDIMLQIALMAAPIAVVAMSPALNAGALSAMRAGNVKRTRLYLLVNNWLLAPLFVGIPFGILYIIGLARAFQN